MQLTYNDTAIRYELIASYDEWSSLAHESKQDIKQILRWDPNAKRWWTKLEENAKRLIDIADEKTREMLVQGANQQKESLEASKATAADIEIPAPEGFDYFPFQRAGIQYALSRPSTLIGDEMGLGKTIQALGLINADKTIKSVCVICPASLKINWQREAERWLVGNWEVAIGDSKQIPDCDFVIINYDVLGLPSGPKERELSKQIKTLYDSPIKEDLKKELKAIKAERLKTPREGLNREFDLLILDESHFIKTPTAGRTKLTREIAKQAKRRLLLTGTPILNRPIELWTQINLLDPERWPNRFRYAKRYCRAYRDRFGWNLKGASHLEELQLKLRQTILVRRLKSEVLLELPPKVRQIIEIDPEELSGLVGKEQEFLEEWEQRIEKLQKQVEAEADAGGVAYKEAVGKLTDAQKLLLAEISRTRHETALAKVPKVLDHIKQSLESVDKLVVFAHHHDVIDGLLEGLETFNPVHLTGKDSQDHRQKAVDTFQTDPECRVFVASILAAGVGITLTAASTVIFAELDWVPGNMCQAEDRLHRIGQESSVLVQHVVLDFSIDAKLAKTLVNKQGVIDRAMNQKVEVDQESEQITLREIILPSTVVRPKPPVASKCADQHTKQEQLIEELPPEQLHSIHEGLKRLANVCDHAQALDGMGFNGLDAPFGHSLAKQSQLTQKQAHFAKRMLRKYRRQLPDDLYETIYLDLLCTRRAPG